MNFLTKLKGIQLILKKTSNKVICKSQYITKFGTNGFKVSDNITSQKVQLHQLKNVVLPEEKLSQYAVCDKICGFTIKNIEHIRKFQLTAVKLIHDVTGGEYLHIDRDDSNKVFLEHRQNFKKPSEGSQNYLKACSLLRKANVILQEHFKYEWRHINGSEWNNGFSSGDPYIFSSGLGQVLIDTLEEHQKYYFYSGLIESFDIKLLYKAVQCLNPEFCEDSFLLLNKIEDELYSYEFPIIKLNDLKYATYWKHISIILLEIGLEIEDIDTYEPQIQIIENLEQSAKCDPDVFHLEASGDVAFSKNLFQEAVKAYSKAILSKAISIKMLGFESSSKSKMTEPKTSASQEINKDFSGNDKFPEKCAICLQLIKNQNIGKPNCCKHQFCASCIFQWHNKSDVCPLDRKLFVEINMYQNKWSTNCTTRFLKCTICRLSGKVEHMLSCCDCGMIMHSHCGVIPMEHIQVPFHGYYLCLKCIKKRSSLMMGPITEVCMSASHLTPRGEDKSSEKCTICFTITKNHKMGSLDSCGHWFCASCIIEWSDKSNVCPLDKKPFTIIFIYGKRNGFLENMYCKCRLCRDNQFLLCTDCKSTVEHVRPNKRIYFFRKPTTNYLCSNCNIQRSRRAATSLNEEVQMGVSARDAQSKATESRKRDDLANSSMSSPVSARNKIKSENQRQENKTRKEDKNHTIHRNKDKDLLLNKFSKKNNSDSKSSFNSRSLQRSRSPIRWRAGSPIRRGAGSPIRRRGGSSIRRRVGSPIQEVSRNSCLLRIDPPSISKSRLLSFRKKQWRRSTYKSSRRSVLWTDDEILKIVVR